MVALFERELDGEVGVRLGMQDQVIRWDDELPVNDYQFMTHGRTSSPRDTHESDGMAVGVEDVRPSGDVN